MGGESLRLFFAEDLCVASISSGYFWVISILRWVQRDPAYEVSVVPDWPGSIGGSGEEFCPLHVWTPEYDREVSVVDPAPFPVYLGLHRREPWVTEDGFVFAKIGEKKLEGDSGVSSSNV